MLRLNVRTDSHRDHRLHVPGLAPRLQQQDLAPAVRRYIYRSRVFRRNSVRGLHAVQRGVYAGGSGAALFRSSVLLLDVSGGGALVPPPRAGVHQRYVS